MKMGDLVDTNKESYRMRELLKQQLSDFRLKYKDYDFTISYDFDGGIRVRAGNFQEWTLELHNRLCSSFGVKLVDMTRTEMYTRRAQNMVLLFHYVPVDSLEEELEWGEFLW